MTSPQRHQDTKKILKNDFFTAEDARVRRGNQCIRFPLRASAPSAVKIVFVLSHHPAVKMLGELRAEWRRLANLAQ
jgi:hypothetical protein